jgi:hypothetical protein
VSKLNIQFNIDPEFDGIFERPVPAKNAIPEWWKKQERYMDNKVTYNKDVEVSHTIKRCMPVMDCMTSGYIVKLPCDIVVDNIDGEQFFSWAITRWKLIEGHSSKQVSQYPIEEKYSKTPLKFKNPFGIKTPKGYSCLFVDPMHADDRPFKCLPAIVDTDEFTTPINFPFLIEKDFSGVIPAGTPIIQVIPFKREEWSSSYGHITKEETNRLIYACRLVADRYLKNFRQPKNFN